MNIFNVLRGAAAVLAIAALQLGQAAAGTISTPVLFLGSSDQSVCIASNVTSGSLTVTVKIIGIEGGGSTKTCTLASNDRPGCEAFFNGSGQCRITLPNTTNDQTRARVRGVMFLHLKGPPYTIEATVQAE